ncbi:unnamed protein product, partial [Effrenium voratum]
TDPNLAHRIGVLARELSMAPTSRARWPRLLLLLAAALVALPLRPASTAAAGGLGGEGEGGSVVSISKSVMAKVRALQAQAQERPVPQLGQKAAELVAEAEAGGPQLGAAVAAALEPLFLRQVRELRSKAASATPEDLAAVSKSEEEFLKEADLGQGALPWHLDKERQHLRAQLDQQVDVKAALAEERARAALTQRSTIEAIGKLQEQMEDLFAKASAFRDGSSPFVLSTSYRIPKTPLQFVSRYEQGRANIELTLTPEKDPTKSEGGFAEAVGPANIGISFDVM